ncbi:MAG TPA: hypothetical protein VKV95_20585 [Terriglobia bacterium]|nr:hypothetical protein [Terriglobia bacterium]
MLLLILIVIVTATLIAQRLVMPPPVYVACSLLGFLGWFVFMLIGGELTIPSGVILGDVLVKWIMVTILTLPLLAAVVGWRGTRSAWRWFFLGLGVILEILMSMIRVVS